MAAEPSLPGPAGCPRAWPQGLVGPSRPPRLSALFRGVVQATASSPFNGPTTPHPSPFSSCTGVSATRPTRSPGHPVACRPQTSSPHRPVSDGGPSFTDGRKQRRKKAGLHAGSGLSKRRAGPRQAGGLGFDLRSTCLPRCLARTHAARGSQESHDQPGRRGGPVGMPLEGWGSSRVPPAFPAATWEQRTDRPPAHQVRLTCRG